ncbi:MAG TPA: patatin-like phospholipase family protein [Puia sp.]|nr:patatin-like phospholipase family protein [Puia sp.]
MPSVSLCLSGGGARGMTHLGVLQHLHENGYQIQAVSGTSAGAIIGVFIADGFHPAEIGELILTNIKRLPVNRHHLKQGLLNINFLRDLVRNNLRTKRIEDLPIPFFANATNYATGRGATFTTGEILDVVIASASIPIVFPPVMIEGVPYVDGGLSCNFNVSPLKKYAFPIVGVFVNPLVPYDPTASIIAQSDRAIHLTLREMILDNIPLCDVYLEPPELKKFTVLNVKSLAVIRDIGYQFAKQMVDASKLLPKQ